MKNTTSIFYTRFSQKEVLCKRANQICLNYTGKIPKFKTNNFSVQLYIYPGNNFKYGTPVLAQTLSLPVYLSVEEI